MSMEVYDSNGIMTFSSNYVKGGAIHEMYSFAANSGQQTLTFPDFAGKTLLVNIIVGESTDFTIDYNLGYPRLIVGDSFSLRYFFITLK